MSALSILDRLDAGRPESERLHRLRERVDALDPGHANLLSELCALDVTEAWRFVHRVADTGDHPASSPRRVESLCALVEGLRDDTLRCRVVPNEEPQTPLSARLEATVAERLQAKVHGDFALEDGEWPPEAERAYRSLVDQVRIRRAAERPLVLEPAQEGAEASGATQVLAALVVNRQLSADRAERSRALQARREAVAAPGP